MWLYTIQQWKYVLFVGAKNTICHEIRFGQTSMWVKIYRFVNKNTYIQKRHTAKNNILPYVYIYLFILIYC